MSEWQARNQWIVSKHAGREAARHVSRDLRPSSLHCIRTLRWISFSCLSESSIGLFCGLLLDVRVLCV